MILQWPETLQRFYNDAPRYNFRQVQRMAIPRKKVLVYCKPPLAHLRSDAFLREGQRLRGGLVVGYKPFERWKISQGLCTEIDFRERKKSNTRHAA